MIDAAILAAKMAFQGYLWPVFHRLVE